MAVSQRYRSGVARTFEISSDGGTSFTDIGGQTGRELIGFTEAISRPSNPTSTNSTARGTEQATTLEVAVSFNGTRTSVTAPILDPLIEPTDIIVRYATENRATGGDYTQVGGIGMLTYSWEAAGVQSWTMEIAVNTEPTTGQFA